MQEKLLKNYNIKTIPHFDKQLKRLVKKFHSLKTEYLNLLDRLEKEPTHGTSIGNDCYKIRLSIASKGKGKSGGARIITYVVINDKTVFLIDIYDKSELGNITDKELAILLKEITET
ncbi:MAG: type II toxin-antitoxin system RelE/ParE family toxin [Chitinophagaceae bacterium]|nr:type II toxin-antitoxin system RelE/ParE family toxin [Chitinophagaceae bacterium]